MMAEKMNDTFQFAIIGGGIAGVSCAEMLSSLCPEVDILLVTASPLIKAIANYKKISKTLEEFDVEERPWMSMQQDCPNVKVIQTEVTSLVAEAHTMTVRDGQTYNYKQICICSGGLPKVIAKDHQYVLGIRDTQSVKEFQKHLHHARRILVIGNGGIATELVYEVQGCEVIWAIKDKSISSAFVDAGAAQFFLPKLNADKEEGNKPSKRHEYTTEDDILPEDLKEQTLGGALGPDWSENLKMTGQQEISHQVHVEYRVEVKVIYTAEEFVATEMTESTLPGFIQDKWPVYVELTNGQLYGCDFVVSATGVVPNTHPFTKNNQFSISADGGLLINEKMETSVVDVYAAGDVCSANWTHSPHWMQMRLWTQARQMGAYTAQCMVAKVRNEVVSLDFCFEMFAHVTKFFGFKVILLGKFNAQGLEGDHELLLRMTKGKEYIKVVLRNGTMQGAVLIGETELEETFENLILNQIDLTPFKDDLLDPNIDLEDFFD
ncbi:pyridine nucleotide-disulfide oxidoreductase domain-containing protein 1-like [Mizuhopecten yessoensis]|uniref:Pyridine nucleotide-disulfide oxidoreductase domain-containing protein 1 n=1 Tax=Mizuhopecten yessoensis TaxID=6573 RepID=A0A210QJQ7_MIZYE|nr:pyridine nucleotide-disulfide oxidoreductase domain-containing protein 1-like [Mizuhopecten yessoensis]OWF48998.1 Pyridine nucleotide-disulfide oxidoreductase domain-containing protein 1 [Mizuhopecten yessoensis]